MAGGKNKAKGRKSLAPKPSQTRRAVGTPPPSPAHTSADVEMSHASTPDTHSVDGDPDSRASLDLLDTGGRAAKQAKMHATQTAVSENNLSDPAQHVDITEPVGMQAQNDGGPFHGVSPVPLYSAAAPPAPPHIQQLLINGSDLVFDPTNNSWSLPLSFWTKVIPNVLESTEKIPKRPNPFVVSKDWERVSTIVPCLERYSDDLNCFTDRHITPLTERPEEGFSCDLNGLNTMFPLTKTLNAGNLLGNMCYPTRTLHTVTSMKRSQTLWTNGTDPHWTC
jgi:hypothetical protein